MGIIRLKPVMFNVRLGSRGPTIHKETLNILRDMRNKFVSDIIEKIANDNKINGKEEIRKIVISELLRYNYELLNNREFIEEFVELIDFALNTIIKKHIHNRKFLLDIVNKIIDISERQDVFRKNINGMLEMAIGGDHRLLYYYDERSGTMVISHIAKHVSSGKLKVIGSL
ncbi:MAG: hypothetical protein ACP5G1_02085 [Nanopusillaceae archaeon]